MQTADLLFDSLFPSDFENLESAVACFLIDLPADITDFRLVAARRGHIAQKLRQRSQAGLPAEHPFHRQRSQPE